MIEQHVYCLDALYFYKRLQLYFFFRSRYIFYRELTYFFFIFVGVIKALNVTVRSEGANDPGKTQPSGLAYIEVNGKNYAPQSKGFNLAAFDALSGKET